MAGYGRLVLQPLVALPLEGAPAAQLRCTAYTVSPIGLLQARPKTLKF